MKRTHKSLILTCLLIGMAWVAVIGADSYVVDWHGGYKRFVELVHGDTTHKTAAVYVDDYKWYTIQTTIPSNSSSLNAIAIDLSNTTGYDHSNTSKIIVKKIAVNACVTHGDANADSEWNIEWGVVVRTGSTNGDVRWFRSDQVAGNLSDGSHKETCYFYETPDGVEYDLEVVSNAAAYITGNDATTNSTDWDNDEDMVDFLGNITTRLGAGDMAWRIVENDGTASLDMEANIIYRTE
jgi:hypothetical protein